MSHISKLARRGDAGTRRRGRGRPPLVLAAAMAVSASLLALAAPAGASVAAGHPGTAPYQFPEPAVGLVKTASTQGYSAAGTPITYTYAVTNTGDVPLTSVTVTDPMARLSAIDCGGGSNVIGSLDVGATQDCTATYTTTASDVANGSITNIGTVTGTTPAGTTVSYNADVTIPGAGGPYTCNNPQYFLSQEPPSNPDTTMWATSPIPFSSPYVYYPGTATLGHYNAIGFDPLGSGYLNGGYIYAMAKSGPTFEVDKIDGTGTVIATTPITLTGAPNRVLVVGGFDNSGIYWVTGGGGSTTTAWGIDVNSGGSPTVAYTVTLQSAFKPADWTWANGYLWGEYGNTLYRVNPYAANPIPVTPFTVPANTLHGWSMASGVYGAAWTYGNGDLGFYNNATGQIDQVSMASGTPQIVYQTYGAQIVVENDGTACTGKGTDLGVTTSGPATVTAGGTVTWNVTVTDNGPGNSSGFVLSDATTGGISDVTTSTPGCAVTGKKQDVECGEGVLDNGDSYTVTLSGTAPQTGKCLVNTAAVTADEADPSPGNNTSTLRTCITSSNPTWTIKPGGAIKGKAGTLTIEDTATGATVTCQAADLSGTLKSGSVLVNPIASLTGLSFGNCTGPLGITFTGTANALPWELNAASYASGVTSGSVTGMDATLSGTGCSATLDGTAAGADDGQVDVSYASSSGKLNILSTGGNLAVYGVSGCFGLISNGDPMTVSGTFTISPKQTITSP